MLNIQVFTRAAVISAVVSAVAAGVVFTLTAPAAAITIPVACSEKAIVEAIDLANTTPAADTLVLAGGCTYALTLPHGGDSNGLPLITTPIEMIGPATITRSSPEHFRIAEVSSGGNLTLTTSVAITKGSVVGNGGGILNHGAVTLTNSSITGNFATLNGGGLANADTPDGTAPAATFTGSPVSNNTALLSGGGIYNGKRATLTTTGVVGSPLIISGNSGSTGGGVAAIDSTATTMTQTAVTANQATSNAGGVYRQGGVVTITSSPISANTPNNCTTSTPAVPDCTD